MTTLNEARGIVNRRTLTVAVSILGIIGLFAIFVVISGSNIHVERQEKPTAEPTIEDKGAYDECVRRCIDAARDANIERGDITDEDYLTIMAEHKNYICPGKCEALK